MSGPEARLLARHGVDPEAVAEWRIDVGPGGAGHLRVTVVVELSSEEVALWVEELGDRAAGS